MRLREREVLKAREGEKKGHDEKLSKNEGAALE